MLQHPSERCRIQGGEMQEKESRPLARASFDIDLCYYSS